MNIAESIGNLEVLSKDLLELANEPRSYNYPISSHLEQISYELEQNARKLRSLYNEYRMGY